MNEIKKAGAKILRRPTVPVKDKEIGRLNGVVLNKFKPLMGRMAAYGIASNQLGYNKSFFIWDTSANKAFGSEVGWIYNPVVLDSSGRATYNEGCLSIPGFFYMLERPKDIYVKGIDSMGEEFAFEATGLEARIIQHEIDHCLGILMVDYLSDEEIEELLEKGFVDDERREKGQRHMYGLP